MENHARRLRDFGRSSLNPYSTILLMTVDNPYHPTDRNAPATGLDAPPGFRRNWKDYSPQYNVALKTALLLQALIGALTLLVLDSGQTTRAFGVALLCQWAMVWIILLRRPMNPTRSDLILARYGIIPLLFFVAAAGPPLLRLVGLQN